MAQEQATQQDMIRVIAEYDGGFFVEETKDDEAHFEFLRSERMHLRPSFWGEPVNSKFTGKLVDKISVNGLKYATSWDWLMPVAIRVYREVTMLPIDEGFEYGYGIIESTYEVDNHNHLESGKLLKAVYEVILFLNEQKANNG